jgi:hypothetical protein
MPTDFIGLSGEPAAWRRPQDLADIERLRALPVAGPAE